MSGEILPVVAVLAARRWYEGERDPDGEVRAVCDSHEALRAEVERLRDERDMLRGIIRELLAATVSCDEYVVEPHLDNADLRDRAKKEAEKP